MSTEHIIQFTYGDDGLDPMFMDDCSQPVSLNRLFTIVKERTKNTAKVQAEPMMYPHEIEAETLKAVQDCPIPNLSDKFKRHFQSFIQSTLVNEISRVRESFGLSNHGVTAKQIKYEQGDTIMLRQLRNCIHITRSQFEEFIQLVWKKY